MRSSRFELDELLQRNHMSSFQDARWLRRLWSLSAPGTPTTPYAQHISIVNDRGYSSSRERAPYASHAGLFAAPGAGIHNFVEVGALDPLNSARCFLHQARFEIIGDIANNLTGLLSWALVDGSTLTTATRVLTTPFVADADPDVQPKLFVGTIETGNLPSLQNIPSSVTTGVTAAQPTFGSRISDVEPLPGLHFALSWLGPKNLMFVCSANMSWIMRITWQGMRD